MEVTTPFDTTLGGAFVEIGNDREDMFINGVDKMQNKAFVRDRGNYGVSYTLKNSYKRVMNHLDCILTLLVVPILVPLR